jgi:hypothetical protein
MIYCNLMYGDAKLATLYPLNRGGPESGGRGLDYWSGSMTAKMATQRMFEDVSG